MIHYKIQRVSVGYYRIKIRGFFRYFDFDGVDYCSASEALRALDKANNGVGCVIKIDDKL